MTTTSTSELQPKPGFTIYALKPAFQNLLRPLLRRMAAAGITPNQITTGALALSLLSAVGLSVAVVAGHPVALLGLGPILLVRMALNALDGMLAREHDLCSPLGSVLNEVGDVVSDAALFLPFFALALLGPAPSPVLALLVGVSAMAAAATEVAGVAWAAAKFDRRYDGPMGKSDRAFLLSVLGAVVAIWGVSVFVEAGFAVLTLGAVATLINRMVPRAAAEA